MAAIPLGDVPAHHAARLGPENWCLRHEGSTLSWGELERRATRRAHALRARGVRKNDVVTLSLPNTNAFYEMTFAIWKLGATPSPVSARLPVPELEAILELTRPRVIIAADPALAKATGALPPDYGLAEGADGSIASQVADHWKAMTSGGSTGRPKVIVDHLPALFDPDQASGMLIPADAAIINTGPCYHNAPFTLSHIALSRGNAVVGLPKFDPEETLRLIHEHRVAWIFMVPTMMNRIWRLPASVRTRYDISSLQTVWHSAAPMPPWLKQAWIDWIGPEKIWEMYGGTEGQGHTALDGREWLEHRGSVGRPLGCEIRILDEAGAPLPPGEIGEIFMKPATGTGSTYHYVGANPKATGDGFESLGDQGWLDRDGYLYIADRRTDLIISGGSNIYPAEVEAALLEHPGVEGAVVIGLRNDDLGATVHAIVKRAATQPELSTETLISFLTDRLVRYKIPRTFEFVTEDLRDDAGKIRRSRLAQQRMNIDPLGGAGS